MYAYIKGKFISYEDEVVVVENNGIGYELSVSNTCFAKLPAVGGEVKLFTKLNVREDEMSLYGFWSTEEKNMFEKLISISGIGPKAAMSILSGMELSSLALCIITEDVKTISKIKGVGKKTAERIVLELKERISTEECAAGMEYSEPLPPTMSLDADGMDAVNALRTLGISQPDAFRAVVAVRAESQSVEEIITNALKSFGN